MTTVTLVAVALLMLAEAIAHHQPLKLARQPKEAP